MNAESTAERALGTSSSAGASAPIPGSTAVLTIPQTCRLVCVEYPGYVKNVDKMLETVGGENGVSKTYSDPSRRLELKFRPRDPYCHPVCGNRFPSTNLLLRVRRKVRKGGNGEVRMFMEIMGVVSTTYKFQGMADFQYLAVHTQADGKQISLYDKIILHKPEKKEFFDMDAPLFIPPPIFSRLDTPVDYYYRPEIQHREGYMPPSVSSENLIGQSRARRPHNAIFVTFEDKTVPMEPLEAAVQNWKRVCLHPSETKAEEEMKKMFERRPIWSRNAVKANLDIHPEKLKLLLPYMAYYMLTGPWRSLWVRFGYDPRTVAEAKIYQVLDFRIRCGMKHGYAPNDMPVKAKRSTYNYSLPTTVNKAVPQPASLREITQEGSTTLGRKPAPPRYKLKESAYIFREGTLPPYRQMFYQLCDLDVERYDLNCIYLILLEEEVPECLTAQHPRSIKTVIHQNDGQELECDERDGWCLPRTADELRDIMSNMIKQIIRAKRPAPCPAKTKRAAAEPESADEEEGADEDEEEFQPSEGSDNEMETEILDYM